MYSVQYIWIRENASLASVEGLCNLKFVHGSDDDGDAIALFGNPQLAHGLPFPALLCMNGKVCIGGNDYVDSHLAALGNMLASRFLSSLLS